MERNFYNLSIYSLVITFFMLFFGFSPSLVANTLQITVENNVNTFPSVTGVSTLSDGYTAQGAYNPNVSHQNINNPSAADGAWRAEYGSELVLIPVGDVIAPIAITPSVEIISNKFGRVSIENGKVSSTTRTAVTSITPLRNSYDKRPTLYISLCGAHDNIFAGTGNGNCWWQTALEDQIQYLSNSTNQYKHFAVDWATLRPTNNQVKQLSDVIKDFLGSRKVAWDVVIVGFSRGGIFAHQLRERLAGYSKINNLYTHLLDPTAAGGLQDFYPTEIRNNHPAGQYSHFYYDNKPFEVGGGVGYMPGLADSDHPITGYLTHYINSSHPRFVTDWFASSNGYTLMQSEVQQNKSYGVYALDGDCGMETVRVSPPDSLVFDGVIEEVNGQLHVAGSLSIGGLPLTNSSFDFYIGAGKLDLAVAMGVVAMRAIVDKDRVAVQGSLVIADFVAQIDGQGISGSIDVLSLEASVEVNWNGSIIIDIPGIHIDVNVTDIINSVGDALNDLGDTLGDIFGW